MTDQTIPVEKLRALLDQFQWEGLTRDELHHVSAAGVLKGIRDLLPPPPLPDPLFGARATHPECGEGIVISHYADKHGYVRFVFPHDDLGDGTSFRWVNPHTLAFHAPDMSKNAAEIDTSTAHVDPIDTTPDHPAFLETEEDYANAPHGTIVAEDDERKAVLVDELWRQAGLSAFGHDAMAGIRRRVLRWGRGE